MVIGTLGTFPDGMNPQRREYLEIREQVDIIQSTELLRFASTLKIVLKTWRDLLSLGLLISNNDNKNK